MSTMKFDIKYIRGTIAMILVLIVALGVIGCSQTQTSAPDASTTPAAQQSNSVTWTGDVDAGVTVNFQGGKSWIDDVKGKAVKDVVANFHGSIPSSGDVTAKITHSDGRGQVNLIQQPTKDNNYTAAVRILDPEAGDSVYHFTLSW